MRWPPGYFPCCCFVIHLEQQKSRRIHLLQQRSRKIHLLQLHPSQLWHFLGQEVRAAPSTCSPKCQVVHGIGIQLPGKGRFEDVQPAPSLGPSESPAERVLDPSIFVSPNARIIFLLFLLNPNFFDYLLSSFCSPAFRYFTWEGDFFCTER